MRACTSHESADGPRIQDVQAYLSEELGLHIHEKGEEGFLMATQATEGPILIEATLKRLEGWPILVCDYRYVAEVASGREAVARLLQKLNLVTLAGQWQQDPDGEVRLRHSVLLSAHDWREQILFGLLVPFDGARKLQDLLAAEDGSTWDVSFLSTPDAE